MSDEAYLKVKWNHFCIANQLNGGNKIALAVDKADPLNFYTILIYINHDQEILNGFF